MIYKYRVVNGRWEVGNLNDKLVSFSFDHFISRHRKHAKPLAPRTKQDLKQHNYKFKFKHHDNKSNNKENNDCKKDLQPVERFRY